MHELLSKNLFLVKEHVGMFKAANNYDVYDPETGSVIMECREPKLGRLTQLLRFTDLKQNTPFDIHLTDTSGRPILRITRGVSILLSRVSVLDADDVEVGGFKQKLFSVGVRSTCWIRTRACFAHSGVSGRGGSSSSWRETRSLPA